MPESLVPRPPPLKPLIAIATRNNPSKSHPKPPKTEARPAPSTPSRCPAPGRDGAPDSERPVEALEDARECQRLALMFFSIFAYACKSTTSETRCLNSKGSRCLPGPSRPCDQKKKLNSTLATGDSCIWQTSRESFFAPIHTARQPVHVHRAPSAGSRSPSLLPKASRIQQLASLRLEQPWSHSPSWLQEVH